MLLGKRPRPPMKRTTSMTITFDLNTTNGQQPPPTAAAAPPSSDPHNPFNNYPKQAAAGFYGGVWGPQIQPNDGGGVDRALDQQLLTTAPSPRVQRRHSAEFLETAHFLSACGLCRRRLVPGRDIYMYRGDTAFCSLECRQQQMNQDERKEKCSVASKKQATVASAPRSGNSAKGETVAAI